ncbi:MAG: nuclear transport factor 2 family protein [Gemmatimonadota bacterium]|nr:nuclear transport factor 2 family protein [Gemmatimonadota bacterium]
MRTHARRTARATFSLAATVSRRIAVPAALAAIAALLGPTTAVSQEDDRAEIMEVIDRLFDGMRENDGEKVGSVFLEGASLIRTEAPDGSPEPRYMAAATFAQAVDDADRPFDEPYWDPIVHIHDHLATVWIKYAFYLGETFSHCGVDAFILARTDDGWRIAALADTSERDNCELPPDRQPFDG